MAQFSTRRDSDILVDADYELTMLEPASPNSSLSQGVSTTSRGHENASHIHVPDVLDTEEISNYSSSGLVPLPHVGVYHLHVLTDVRGPVVDHIFHPKILFPNAGGITVHILKVLIGDEFSGGN